MLRAGERTAEDPGRARLHGRSSGSGVHRRLELTSLEGGRTLPCTDNDMSAASHQMRTPSKPGSYRELRFAANAAHPAPELIESTINTHGTAEPERPDVDNWRCA